MIELGGRDVVGQRHLPSQNYILWVDWPAYFCEIASGLGISQTNRDYSHIQIGTRRPCHIFCSSCTQLAIGAVARLQRQNSRGALGLNSIPNFKVVIVMVAVMESWHVAGCLANIVWIHGLGGLHQ
jgi:hypothetical protein